MAKTPPEEALKPCTMARQLVEVVIGMVIAGLLGLLVFHLNKAPNTIIAFISVFALTGVCLLAVHFVMIRIWPCDEKRSKSTDVN